jgi:YegS/Rv2252/BmrU family lipid kinase
VLPTFFILNPRSGHGKSEKLIPLIRAHFRENKVPFDLHVTTCPDEARKVASEVKKKYPIVIAGGGDGTVNEVVNGIAGSDSALGLLPLGSGNDFAKALAYPRKLNECLQVLTKQQVKSIDLGSIEVINSGLERTNKHFVNFAGIGLDAEVANEAGKIFWARGLTKYAIAAMKVLLRYKAESSTVNSLEFESEGRHLLISIGNGKSSGGGFYLTPQALLDDGWFDVCMAKNLSTPEILRIFPFVLIGKHARFQKINMKRTKKLVVKSRTNLPVHVDGEVIGLDIREISVEVIPLGIKILTP